MYRRVLFTTDGSEFASDAIPEVARLAGPDTEVVVVQAVDALDRVMVQMTPVGFDPQNMSGPTTEAVAQVVTARHHSARRHLDEAEARLRRAGVTHVSLRVLEGLPGPAIVEAAEENRCDVIVMATHGRSGVRRAVLGSVADYVVRNTRRAPVLLVPPTCVREERRTGGA